MTHHVDLKIREIKDRLDAECAEAKRQRDLYWQHLIGGGEPSAWKFPYGASEDFAALNNAPRLDMGKHPIPYLPGTENYVVCAFMLDERGGEWVTPAEILKALKTGHHGSWRGAVQVSSMLKDYFLRRVGLALDKVERPVAYRLVVVPVEDE